MPLSDDEQPGPLLGAGRAADVFDIGDGRVLRRNRNGASTETEAAVMTHLHSQRYPVPEVFGAEGPDLIMERIDGPTMLEAFGRHPWRLRSFAAMLARLIDELSAIPLPDVDLLTASTPGSVIVHGDLHPDNVMLSPNGPIVIDWPNARAGLPGADLASTWVLVATSRIDATGLEGSLQSVGRSLFLHAFLRRVDRPLAHSMLEAASAHRRNDRNLHPEEAVDIDRLLVAEGLSSPPTGE